VAALGDADARRELAALARDPRGWLGPDDAEWAATLADRARRAAVALADAPLAGPSDLATALAAAARLFDAALFFEVHEVLEPHWLAARDEAREALQGLIQIAVAWQHLANGNVAGARSLLTDGAARLHGRRLGGVDFDPFARAALDAVAALPAATPPAFPRLPR
jgi:predicted metal-dependent hydrolase